MEKQESIRNLKGIGEKTEKLFHILGVDTVEDLLHYYPREYEQYQIPVTLSSLKAGEKTAVQGTITPSVSLRNTGRLTLVTTKLQEAGQELQLGFRKPAHGMCDAGHLGYLFCTDQPDLVRQHGKTAAEAGNHS